VAAVTPFRAARYAPAAGPLERLVAPPYDVISAAQREQLAGRDPHNVVHLTLAASEEDAGTRFRSWLAEGVLEREERPAVWTLVQEYVGPDGVRRVRSGVVAALRAEPYERRVVLPHERTHEEPKESRLRLLRAARAQLEPIFLLHEGPAPLRPPARPPELEAEGTRLWRSEEAEAVRAAAFFADRQLVIADGHHRYETALAYHARERTEGSDRVLAVLVSTADPGLEIFPTHRVFRGHEGALPAEGDEDVEAALAELARLGYERAHAVGYRPGGASLLHGEPGELDVELVERLIGHEGIVYTPDWREAVGLVDRGEADGAFLLRATRIEDVFARSRRGEVLPPKTTYFFPKLLSGLLFLPLEP
jgi:uncharacterized protein (DUF1015 family)